MRTHLERRSAVVEMGWTTVCLSRARTASMLLLLLLSLLLLVVVVVLLLSLSLLYKSGYRARAISTNLGRPLASELQQPCAAREQGGRVAYLAAEKEDSVSK